MTTATTTSATSTKGLRVPRSAASNAVVHTVTATSAPRVHQRRSTLAPRGYTGVAPPNRVPESKTSTKKCVEEISVPEGTGDCIDATPVLTSVVALEAESQNVKSVPNIPEQVLSPRALFSEELKKAEGNGDISSRTSSPIEHDQEPKIGKLTSTSLLPRRRSGSIVMKQSLSNPAAGSTILNHGRSTGGSEVSTSGKAPTAADVSSDGKMQGRLPLETRPNESPPPPPRLNSVGVSRFYDQKGTSIYRPRPLSFSGSTPPRLKSRLRSRSPPLLVGSLGSPRRNSAGVDISVGNGARGREVKTMPIDVSSVTCSPIEMRQEFDALKEISQSPEERFSSTCQSAVERGPSLEDRVYESAPAAASEPVAMSEYREGENGPTKITEGGTSGGTVDSDIVSSFSEIHEVCVESISAAVAPLSLSLKSQDGSFNEQAVSEGQGGEQLNNDNQGDKLTDALMADFELDKLCANAFVEGRRKDRFKGDSSVSVENRLEMLPIALAGGGKWGQIAANPRLEGSTVEISSSEEDSSGSDDESSDSEKEDIQGLTTSGEETTGWMSFAER